MRAASLIRVALFLSLTAVPSPSARAAASGIQRLPRGAVPTFQAIRLTIDPARTGYEGSVRVDLDVRETTRVITFHAQEVELTRVELEGRMGTVTLATQEGDDGVVTATAPSTIEKGPYTLSVDFTNEFDTRATSLYRLDSGGEAYAFTQFEAVDARLAFPCWDEPDFKFPYQLTITVPEALEAITNTPEEIVTIADGWKTITFHRTKPLPSYLLALAVGPLEYVPVHGTSIPTRIVTPKGSADLAKAAAAMTPPILAALERYFERRYPYEKLDIVAVPEFTYGAMENPGAVTFADRYLLFDRATMSAEEHRTLVRFLAHELAHMWFGDLVTMAWWDDLWLNESFSEWMAAKIADETFPELEYSVSTVAQVQSAKYRDASPATRAIRQPVMSTENLLTSADELAYEKGLSLLGMFEQWMGPDRFRQGVIAYLTMHEWGNTTADDLWEALSDAAGRDMAAPMSTFLDQPGIPNVDVRVVPDGSLQITQSRFLRYGAEAPTAAWQIPVVLRYSSGGTIKTHAILLSEARSTIRLPGGAPQWVHPNANERGYYRYSVDAAMLQRLASLGPEALNDAERLGLVHNLGALLQAGVLRADEYMGLLTSFARDPHPAVIDALRRSVGELKIAFATKDLGDAFAGYVRRLLGPALDRFGLEQEPGEAEAVSRMRPGLIGVLGDEGRDRRVLEHAERLARSFLEDRSSIDPSLIAVALSLSAIRGDGALLGEYRARFEQASVPSERRPYLEAMGAFRDPGLQDSALAYVFQGPLRPQEFDVIPQTMSFNGDEAARDKAFEWMTEHYDAIVSKMPPFYATYMPWLAYGCEERRIQAARAFFSEPARSPAGTEEEIKKVEETVTQCTSLRERDGEAVARYLTGRAQTK